MFNYFCKQLSIRRYLRQWQKITAAWRRFWESYRNYVHLVPENQKPLLKNLYPCIGDDTVETKIDPIYFYQDAWAFEKIVQQRPIWHVDVGSHHKYVALLSKVIPVTMVDIRPLSLPLDTLTFQEGTILDLPFDNESVLSLSSLCVVEHIGLGRYGDPLDPYGTEKAIQELKRVLAMGGNLFISVPIEDENRTYFNAHRAFSETYLFKQFAPLILVEKRYIFGNDFSDQAKSGFGIGCYHLQRV
jgi:SAM-dependent methyltransferase